MTTTTPRTMTPDRVATAVGNETLKGLRHGWSERLQIVIEMPLFVAFVLLLGFTIGEGESIVADQLDWTLDTQRASWLMIGFVAFSYTYLHVQKMFWRLLSEIQTGTLEQTYLSPLPSWVHVVAGRIASAVVETAIVVGIVYAVISVFAPIELHWQLEAVVPLVLLITGAAGLALIIAGIALVWKRVMLLNDLALSFMMFFSGALFPLAELPGWAQAIGEPIFLTHSVEALRIAMLGGAPMPWRGVGGWALTLATAFAWFGAGLIVFYVCERIARQRGNLARF
jgi:ABC-2 type transport system permease protein